MNHLIGDDDIIASMDITNKPKWAFYSKAMHALTGKALKQSLSKLKLTANDQNLKFKEQFPQIFDPLTGETT